MEQIDEEFRVTAADLVRHFGKWQDRASARPIFVTHHGRDRFVLQSAGSYMALRSRGRPEAATGAGDQALLDQMSEGFIAFDPKLVVTTLNQAAAAFLKLDPHEAIGTKLFEEGAMRRTLLFRHLAHTLKSGAFGTFDAPSPAFADRWLGVRTFLHRDGVACLLRDITETVLERRREAQATAIEAAVPAHGAIGRAWLSPRGTFTRVDEVLAAMTGLAPEAMAGARLIDILPVARRHMAGNALETVLSGGGVQAISTALLRNDGSELAVRVAITGVRDDLGQGGAIALVTAG